MCDIGEQSIEELRHIRAEVENRFSQVLESLGYCFGRRNDCVTNSIYGITQCFKDLIEDTQSSSNGEEGGADGGRYFNPYAKRSLSPESSQTFVFQFTDTVPEAMLMFSPKMTSDTLP